MEDEKLTALLNEKFGEINARLGGIDARFDGIDARFDGVDARFDGVDGQFEGINARLDGLETEVRKLRVDTPELKNMLQRNNELIHAVDEKLERFRGETAANFKDVRSDIRMSFTVLGKRISKLEDNHS